MLRRVALGIGGHGRHALAHRERRREREIDRGDPGAVGRDLRRADVVPALQEGGRPRDADGVRVEVDVECGRWRAVQRRVHHGRGAIVDAGDDRRVLEIVGAGVRIERIVGRRGHEVQREPARRVTEDPIAAHGHAVAGKAEDPDAAVEAAGPSAVVGDDVRLARTDAADDGARQVVTTRRNDDAPRAVSEIAGPAGVRSDDVALDGDERSACGDVNTDARVAADDVAFPRRAPSDLDRLLARAGVDAAAVGKRDAQRGIQADDVAADPRRRHVRGRLASSDADAFGVLLLDVVSGDQVAVGGIRPAEFVADAAEKHDPPDLPADAWAARHGQAVRGRSEKVPEDLDSVAGSLVDPDSRDVAAVDGETPDDGAAVGTSRDSEADRVEVVDQGLPIDLDGEDGVGPLRKGQRVGRGARLRVAVDRRRLRDRRERRQRRDRVEPGARDRELDRVGPAAGRGVEDGLAERAGAGVVRGGDGESRGRERSRDQCERESELAHESSSIHGSRRAFTRKVAICPRVLGFAGQ